MATAEMTMDDVSTSWGWKIRLTWWMIKYSTIAAIIIVASFTVVTYTTKAGEWAYSQAMTGYSWALSQLPKSESVRFIQPEKIPTEQLLDLVSREMDFDPTVLRAIAQQESGGYTDTNRVREEPHLLESWRDQNGKLHPPRIKPPADLNRIEKMLWASSHGVLQIIFGFHYKTCGLPENGWDQLHDPLTNIRCGAKILKTNADRYRGTVKDRSKRLWFALRDYNGTGPEAEAYADRVMRRITQLRNLSYGEGL